MTPELYAMVDRFVAAERAGDAAEALAYHSGIPMFRGSRHRALLEQLVGAAGELTPWVWARWIVYQSLRCEDPGSRTGVLQQAALLDATRTFHADLLDAAYDAGDDPLRVLTRVLGESWACQQLSAYDYGTLASFLDEFAAGELAESAELARSWVGVAMGGYRIGGRTGPAALSVHEAVSGDRHTVLDLGAAEVVAGAAGWVIGRLVPSGTTPALMFDSTPLAVEETVARDVAVSAKPWGWRGVVQRALEEQRMSTSDLLRDDYELMTDVLSLRLVEFGTPPTDLARVMAQLSKGRDEVGRAAFRILRSAAEGSLDDDAAPYVAAAVLNAHAYGDARRILAPGQQRHWTRWAELTPVPARGRLLRFAALTADAA